ncbi:ABC transporter substrate-binding protein [Lacrimispora sp. NSJ-141]|uniref:ABC transporter substrate-binding protein n=1 Tax=Lientehia hominis TaxID=2897778 RepID=A0AAP2RIA1_9FIRM|nr:ABC transporter substrate-binding protein [Lientehia hominis]MCD2491838.1 ABC transporter substrate-binding protein [Lientehia hominis]
MNKRLKKITAAVLSLLLVLGLAACGNAKDDGGSTKSGQDKTTAETEKETKVMNFGSTGYFAAETMDPANGWDGWYMTYDGTMETLFRLDESCSPVEFLAEAYENVDNLTWKFTLRDDVTFQNGEKMTADAVKKCFERTYEVSDRAKEQIPVESIEADGQVLTFHLEKENVTLINDLTDPLWSVYDSENSNFTDTLYATGPYIITEFEPFKETVVKKYEGYWGGEPKLDEAHLITINDTEALSMALQSGEIDMAVAMPTSAISMFQDNADYVVDAVTTSRGNRMYYNMDRPALKEEVVRQAISMCIDREGVAESIYNGMAAPSYGIFPEFLPYGGTEGLDLTVTIYDPDGAKALLAEAGWSDSDGNGTLDKDGVELELRAVTFSSRKELGQFLELLQSELSGIGIKLTVDVMENTSDVQASGEYDLDCETGVMVPTGNAQYFFNMMAVSGGSSNWSHYSNPKLDELAQTLEKTSDEGERTSLIRQMVQMILDDNALTIFNHQKMTNIYSKNVTGYRTHPSEYYLLDVNMDINK